MTAQAPERLILNGEEVSMMFCPPLPPEHSRIIRIDEASIDSLDLHSTACRRRYIGTWEISDNLFYLSHLAGCYKILGRHPIFADWFSGVIRICKGDQLEYVHMGFASTYEHETHLNIKAGKVLNNQGLTQIKPQEQIKHLDRLTDKLLHNLSILEDECNTHDYIDYLLAEAEAEKWLKRITLAQTKGRPDLAEAAKILFKIHTQRAKQLRLQAFESQALHEVSITRKSKNQKEYLDKLTSIINKLTFMQKDDFIDKYDLLNILVQ